MIKRLFFLVCCSALLLSGCGGASAPEEPNASELKDLTVAQSELEETGDFPAYSAQIQTTPAQTKAREVVDGMNYFSFHTDTKIYQNEEGQDLLWDTFTDPVFYSPDTQLHDWVNGVLDGICKSETKLSQDLLDYAEEEQERIGEEFYSFSHYFTLGVGRHDTKVASVMALSSMYSGGPHPSSIQTSVNLDMHQLQVLTLENVLEEGAEAKLLTMVLDCVQDTFAAVGEEGLYSDYAVTVENALTWGNMTSHWYFNEVGLVVFFNQYELAPFAAGIIKAELPYGTLGGILRQEYLPEVYTGTASGVDISKTRPSAGEICPVSYGDGQTLYLRVEGKASHVQLSNVYFAEGVPVGETMLFSANFLDDSVTIALQGDWNDGETVYGVEYSDAEGGPYVIYSTSAEIWNELS